MVFVVSKSINQLKDNNEGTVLRPEFLKNSAKDQTWKGTPSVSVMCRVYKGSVLEFYNTLALSYLIFWPQKQWVNSDMVVIADDEEESDHRFMTVLAQLPPYPTIYFEKKPKEPTFCSNWRREG